MILTTYSTNSTDTTLNGDQCLPDVSAYFNGISAARSHGLRYRSLVIEPEPSEFPPAVKIPATLPSGDVVYAATGVGGENFDSKRADSFILSTAGKLGQETMTDAGGATFAMLVKSSDSVKMLLAGDCIISVIGRDQNGKPKVSQLTYDKVGTRIFETPKYDAKPDADGNYAPEDMQEEIHACPENHIGMGWYEASTKDIVTLSYEKLARDFGEDAIFVVSTDGFYDGVQHSDYKYFAKEQQQSEYLRQLADELHRVHEAFLSHAVNELHAKGYDHTHPNFAELLTRYARNHETKLGITTQRCSIDDTGIICIKAEKPKTPDEQAVVITLDAIGSTKLNGVKTARLGADIVAEQVEKYTPGAAQEKINAITFNYKEFVKTVVDCELKYRSIDEQNKIVFEFDEPKWNDHLQGKYEDRLPHLGAIFGAQVQREEYIHGVNGSSEIKTRVRILLDPEQADKVVGVTTFVQEHLFGRSCKVNMHHDNSLNELAVSEFVAYYIQPEETRKLQELLQKTEAREAQR